MSIAFLRSLVPPLEPIGRDVQSSRHSPAAVLDPGIANSLISFFLKRENAPNRFVQAVADLLLRIGESVNYRIIAAASV
jgi:hypothetical protein